MSMMCSVVTVHSSMERLSTILLICQHWAAGCCAGTTIIQRLYSKRVGSKPAMHLQCVMWWKVKRVNGPWKDKDTTQCQSHGGHDLVFGWPSSIPFPVWSWGKFARIQYVWTRSTAHLQLASLGSHHSCSSQFPLALLTWDRAVHGQSLTLICADIPESTGPCCWSTRSMFPPLCMPQSPDGSVHQISTYWTYYPQQSPTQCDFSSVTVNLLSTSENLSFLSFFSRHYPGQLLVHISLSMDLQVI